jgi:hypothetical protein
VHRLQVFDSQAPNVTVRTRVPKGALRVQDVPVRAHVVHGKRMPEEMRREAKSHNVDSGRQRLEFSQHVPRRQEVPNTCGISDYFALSSINTAIPELSPVLKLSRDAVIICSPVTLLQSITKPTCTANSRMNSR